MTVIIFSIVTMSNKTCSMYKKNSFTLKTTINDNEKQRIFNDCYNSKEFLKKNLMARPCYGWKPKDYIYNCLKIACCCLQGANDNKKNSQAIETSINNLNTSYYKNQPLLIKTKT